MAVTLALANAMLVGCATQQTTANSCRIDRSNAFAEEALAHATLVVVGRVDLVSRSSGAPGPAAEYVDQTLIYRMTPRRVLRGAWPEGRLIDGIVMQFREWADGLEPSMVAPPLPGEDFVLYLAPVTRRHENASFVLLHAQACSFEGE
jgi:hypothetical protein